MVVEVAEEGVEVTTNKGGVAAAPVVAIDEVGVVKTTHNITELRTSEKRKKSAL
jgi:hypothetical protein